MITFTDWNPVARAWATFKLNLFLNIFGGIYKRNQTKNELYFVLEKKVRKNQW